MGVVGFERSMAYEFKLVDRADGRRDFAADGLIAIVEFLEPEFPHLSQYSVRS
jgi:hypothetical protein